jgi:hypothetical protein
MGLLEKLAGRKACLEQAHLELDLLKRQPSGRTSGRAAERTGELSGRAAELAAERTGG